ncbi:hypothetical protein CVD28_01435 [Bacillus sp. M6-12]|uniref:hypothetical protein n=1 Tax=Bacillus sp. M6-12 TaxID=2054166 RepID=UPI000C782444|nr:hypothetical protein [Bacillus sp. M6-12]PLS19097.1 hypothetical protein CVD28_01435 [Bacillus sp. M6-12]
MQVNTQNNQVAHAQYQKISQTESVKSQQETQKTDSKQAQQAQTQTQKTDSVKATHVENSTSAQAQTKAPKVDKVEISDEARKLYAESVKQKEAETVKAETVKQAEMKQTEKPKEEVSEATQNLVASLNASQTAPVARPDAQAPVQKDKEAGNVKKVDSVTQTSTAK